MRYHPLYEGIWGEPKLDGCALEERGFAIFLFSNARVRPSGIYRMTDPQAAADTGLPVKRVNQYLTDLHHRHFVVRDQAWLFVIGYLNLQPKQERLLRGVAADVAACSSRVVLEAFGEKYPHLRRWSDDRLATIENPRHGIVSTEQFQSSIRAEQFQIHIPPPSETPHGGSTATTISIGSDPAGVRDGSPLVVTPATTVTATPPVLRDVSGAGAPAAVFRIPTSVAEALDRAPTLGHAAKLRDPAWWQAEIRANPGVDYTKEILSAEAWMRSNPSKAPKTEYARFLHSWLRRADRPREDV